MEAVDLMRSYGCPEYVAVKMAANATPLLRAIMAIGPLRCRWRVGPKRVNGQGGDLTCWTIDGKRATEDQIFSLAGGPSPQFPAGVYVEGKRR
jgi:hypothetical protein